MSTKNTYKIFTALSLPDDVREFLHDIQKSIASALDYEYRPVRVENLHITLTFVGNVSPEQLERATESLKNVICSQLTLQITGIEIPAGKRSGLQFIWARILPSNELLDLKRRNDESLLEFLNHKEALYTPHITLFRLKKIRNLSRIKQVVSHFSAAPKIFTISSFELFSSEQHDRGVDYRKLATY